MIVELPIRAARVALFSVVAVPAAAQTTTAPTSEAGQIVVTGERQPNVYATNAAISFGYAPLSLLETPQSLQVLTRDLIRDQGALSLAELFNNVAGASNSLGRSTPFGTASTQIRGQDISIYRDGLRDVDFSDIDSSALVNVERVEVLKGPAGLVFGTGGPGGIANIVTKAPTDAFAAEVVATLGERDTKIIGGDISVPLGGGFGVRVTAELERSDSFIDFSEIERDNYAAVIAYDGDGLRAVARYERHSNRDDNAMTRIGLPTIGTITRRDVVRIARGRYLGEPSFDFTESFGDQASVFVAWDASDQLSLQAAGRRSTVNFEQGDIRTISQLNPTTLTIVRTRGRELDLESEQYNARTLAILKLPGRTLSQEITVGYEYFQQDLAFENRNLPNAAIPPISVVAPVYLAGGLREQLGAPVPFEQITDTHELFAQNVVRLGGLTVTGALRHIWSEFDSSDRLENTVYQLGAAYKLTDRLSVFAGANTGFDAHADIAADRSRTGERFDPETYRQLEAGVKTDLLAGVTATLAVFRLTRKNILVADPDDGSFLIQAGRERSQGVEADAVWNVSDALALRGGYAYLDAEISADTDPARVGLRKPGAPRHQFNAYGAYTFRNGPLRNLRLSAAAVHSGRTFASISNLALRPAYTIANFTASYSLGRHRLDAILTNAFDERYFIARNEAQVNAGEPRLFTVRLAASF